MRRAVVLLGCAIGLTVGTQAMAEPQVNAGARVGASWGRDDLGGASGTNVLLGLHGDVLFGREGPWSWAVGPAMDGWTDWSGWAAGGGLSVLAPVTEVVPAVFTFGGQWRQMDGVGEAQGTAELFVGSRSYNYHGVYGMAGGLVVGGRLGFGERKERGVSVALHLDGEVLMLPVVLLVSAVRGK